MHFADLSSVSKDIDTSLYLMSASLTTHIYHTIVSATTNLHEYLYTYCILG